MNKNINNFIYSKILDENKLKKNEEILKNIFDIDINCVFNIFDDIIDNGNAYEYGVRNEIFDNNTDIKLILEGIHNITIYIMDTYNIDMEEYSFGENHYLNWGIKECINNYIFNNLIYKMYIEYEFNKDSKVITRKKAIEKYMKIYDPKYKEYVKNCNLEDKIEDKNRNIIKKIKKINKKLKFWDQFENAYTDKRKLYSFVSNTYIEIIENYLKDLFYIDGTVKESKHYCLNNIIEHVEDYINKIKKFSEIYYFERSTNILFILSMYKNITGINDWNKKNILYNTLTSINYLPNILYSEGLIRFFEKILFEEDDDNKIEEINRFCFELAFFTIPLYEIIFASVTKRYCDKKCIKYNTFLSKVYKEFNIKDVKKHILDLNQPLKDEKIFLDNNDELIEFAILFNEIFDFKKFNRKDTISLIGTIDKDFIENIIGDNIGEYKKILKKFLVDIVNI